MGLFGSRKKTLSDIIGGLDPSYDDGSPMGGQTGGIYGTYGRTVADQPAPDAQTDPSAGDVGGGPQQHHGFNWGRAGLGLIGGRRIATMFAHRDAQKFAQQKYDEQQAEVQQQQHAAFTWAKKHGYSDEDAAALAVHPETIAAMVQANHAPQRFDSGGGSIMQDGRITTAPRFDSDGNIYAPSVTQPGQQFQVPQRVQSGTKAIPVQPGGQVQIHDSVTGKRLGGQGSTFQVGEVFNGYRFKGGDDTDPNNWESVNGGPSAGRSGGFLRGRY